VKETSIWLREEKFDLPLRQQISEEWQAAISRGAIDDNVLDLVPPNGLLVKTSHQIAEVSVSSLKK
jgi:hypothetical protein